MCETICLPLQDSFLLGADKLAHTLSLSKTEQRDDTSPETGVAVALVRRLTLTWWFHTTGVPKTKQQTDWSPLGAAALKRILPHGGEESEKTLTKGNVTSSKLD